ncbi:TrwC relaxase [Babesia caballi]|uniref:TrwC relaxase n=1 Tax=Babesia caballi TaxID=5871 RepID=A0AAV4LSU9_BABCB|nr:TrwC relaxase [Babesia caballi]
MYVSFVTGRGVPEVSRASGGTVCDEAYIDGPEGGEFGKELPSDGVEEGVDGFKQVSEWFSIDDGLELGMEVLTGSLTLITPSLPALQPKCAEEPKTVTIQQREDVGAVDY